VKLLKTLRIKTSEELYKVHLSERGINSLSTRFFKNWRAIRDILQKKSTKNKKITGDEDFEQIKETSL